MIEFPERCSGSIHFFERQCNCNQALEKAKAREGSGPSQSLRMAGQAGVQTLILEMSLRSILIETPDRMFIDLVILNISETNPQANQLAARLLEQIREQVRRFTSVARATYQFRSQKVDGIAA